ncbi:hypothetical protein BCV70DRAFT_217600 [Testicularia cyperi]|uniref:Uncharacterized protein n=1 Tax=Testicularia cyperi TaxID=1882483 RepID=A0A317XNH3_9BASI|nr:hypothetical protein BCV70DRAFT_217600 [Testicularia cyperi]
MDVAGRYTSDCKLFPVAGTDGDPPVVANDSTTPPKPNKGPDMNGRNRSMSMGEALRIDPMDGAASKRAWLEHQPRRDDLDDTAIPKYPDFLPVSTLAFPKSPSVLAGRSSFNDDSPHRPNLNLSSPIPIPSLGSSPSSRRLANTLITVDPPSSYQPSTPAQPRSKQPPQPRPRTLSHKISGIFTSLFSSNSVKDPGAVKGQRREKNRPRGGSDAQVLKTSPQDRQYVSGTARDESKRNQSIKNVKSKEPIGTATSHRPKEEQNPGSAHRPTLRKSHSSSYLLQLFSGSKGDTPRSPSPYPPGDPTLSERNSSTSSGQPLGHSRPRHNSGRDRSSLASRFSFEDDSSDESMGRDAGEARLRTRSFSRRRSIRHAPSDSGSTLPSLSASIITGASSPLLNPKSVLLCHSPGNSPRLGPQSPKPKLSKTHQQEMSLVYQKARQVRAEQLPPSTTKTRTEAPNGKNRKRSHSISSMFSWTSTTSEVDKAGPEVPSTLGAAAAAGIAPAPAQTTQPFWLTQELQPPRLRFAEQEPSSPGSPSSLRHPQVLQDLQNAPSPKDWQGWPQPPPRTAQGGFAFPASSLGRARSRNGWVSPRLGPLSFEPLPFESPRCPPRDLPPTTPATATPCTPPEEDVPLPSVLQRRRFAPIPTFVTPAEQVIQAARTSSAVPDRKLRRRSRSVSHLDLNAFTATLRSWKAEAGMFPDSPTLGFGPSATHRDRDRDRDRSGSGGMNGVGGQEPARDREQEAKAMLARSLLLSPHPQYLLPPARSSSFDIVRPQAHASQVDPDLGSAAGNSLKPPGPANYAFRSSADFRPGLDQDLQPQLKVKAKAPSPLSLSLTVPMGHDHRHHHPEEEDSSTSTSNSTPASNVGSGQLHAQTHTLLRSPSLRAIREAQSYNSRAVPSAAAGGEGAWI